MKQIDKAAALQARVTACSISHASPRFFCRTYSEAYVPVNVSLV